MLNVSHTTYREMYILKYIYFKINANTLLTPNQKSQLKRFIKQ